MSSLSDAAPLEEATVSSFIEAAEHFSRPRCADFDMKVGIGDCALLVAVRNGTVQSIDDLDTLRPLTAWQFSLSADAESWRRFWEPVPQAGWHDIFALMRNGKLRIEGNLHPFMAHLQLVKDLLASPRAKIKK